MKTIKENITNEIIINKSKFITILEYVETKEEVENILKKYKKIYKDATHCCYGYILENTEKCSDDGEPNSTAGKPILNVLKSNNLTNVLAIVIRYFGGIKLGAGGLVRAYSNSIVSAIEKTTICNLLPGFNITITFNYDEIKNIDNLISNVINKTFTDKIIYNFNITKEEYLEKQTIIDKYIINKKPILMKV